MAGTRESTITVYVRPIGCQDICANAFSHLPVLGDPDASSAKSNFVIRCEDHEFHVHQHIICEATFFQAIIPVKDEVRQPRRLLTSSGYD